MNAEQYAIETTKREIDDAYIDLRRMLQVGQRENAVKQALGLARSDAAKLWNFPKLI